MPSYELIPFDDPAALAEAVAEAWLTTLASNERENRPYLVALSGGRIAGNFFAAIARKAKQHKQSLAYVHFFWADERGVPPDDAESNFKLASVSLFQPLGISADHIHRIRGELAPNEAALNAATELASLTFGFAHGQPVLDLVFLGMGEDGHIASLFPDLTEKKIKSKDAYVAVVAGKPPPQRISLTYAAISAAKEVWVLASGPGKVEALQLSLGLNGQTPLARLLGMRRQTRIFSDIKLAP